MGFCKRAASTSKPEIPELAKREAKLLLQYQVANLVEKYAVPHQTIMNKNFDQTPSKLAPVSSRTLDTRGTSHVTMAGMSYIKTFFETKFCIRYCLLRFTFSFAI